MVLATLGLCQLSALQHLTGRTVHGIVLVISKFFFAVSTSCRGEAKVAAVGRRVKPLHLSLKGQQITRLQS